MKSGNQPLKKNERRIKASERIMEKLKTPDLPEKEINRLKSELESLNSKIVSEDAARARRTKIYRGVKT